MRRTDPTQNENRRHIRMIGIICLVIILGTAIGVGAYGLFVKPRVDPAPTASPSVSAAPKPTPTSQTSGTPAPLRDPEGFARQTALMLFEWDTLADNPNTISQRIVDLGDPTGNETAGLASDIGNYLPDNTIWAKLRQYETRQWLDIKTVEVPSSWDETKVNAPDGSILPGTTAYTITGIRHRDGTYQGNPTTSEHEVSFTVFVTCAPSFPECHLMRLSQLDNPLK